MPCDKQPSISNSAPNERTPCVQTPGDSQAIRISSPDRVPVVSVAATVFWVPYSLPPYSILTSAHLGPPPESESAVTIVAIHPMPIQKARRLFYALTSARLDALLVVLLSQNLWLHLWLLAAPLAGVCLFEMEDKWKPARSRPQSRFSH